ncbi:hypothetical protein LTR78_003238 [Recurvomyces mirabilis]|uniref:Zinc-finger domain-containing protein n=1 Tax=Recurvomyces mirabilis TaxID=574656 RepID=A0AAE0WSI8_9PEZI|nr:hypothetical protein LTR78_003238 [Recurvomyces mirabilis]KAK5156945.1 hypothetical protein LTS14_004462 [Recurvomyces mirabilis]
MAHSMPFQFGVNGTQPQQQQTSQNTAHSASNGHNALVMQQQQQPNPPQPASIPGLPGNLASLLQGVSPEQLLGILQALQSGQLTGLPPAVPTAPAPEVQHQTATPVAPMLTQPSVLAEQDVDMDKEEGELEEGLLEPDISRQGDSLHSGPGPSMWSASPGDPYSRGQNDGRDRRLQKTDPATSRRSSFEVTPGQRDASLAGNNVSATLRRNTGASARNFVLQMHNAGYTFDDLARDIRNRKALVRMYKTLGLPISTEGRANGVTAPPPAVSQLDGTAKVSSAVIAEEHRPSATKRPPPPRPAAPADRAEYLAKLAAARTSKNKPPGIPATSQPAPTPTQQTVKTATQAPTSRGPAPSLAAPAALPIQIAPAPATPSTALRPNAQPSGRSVIQTELIKQRLEALKAEQAAKKLAAQQASSDAAISIPVIQSSLSTHATSAAPQSPSVGLGAGLADITRQAVVPVTTAIQSTTTFSPSVQPSYSPFPPTPSRSYGSLPGLFMASTPAQLSKTQAPPALPLSISAASESMSDSTQAALRRPAASATTFNQSGKRAAATDFDEDTPTRGQDASNKRHLFGQSRSNSDSERVVIEVSDNEDDDDGMGIDITAAQLAIQGTARGSRSLPGLQQRLSAFSAPSSPQVAADMDLRIADLKRKIAEREATKAQAKASGARSVTSTSAPGQATPSANIGTTRDQLQESRIVAAQQILTSAGRPADVTVAAHTARKQEMYQLSQRLQELQEQVARHDGVPAGASPVQTRAQPPSAHPTTSIQSSIQHTVAAAAPITASSSNPDNTAPGNTVPPVAQPAQPVQVDGAHLDTKASDGGNQIGSQATTISDVAQSDLTTETAVADLPAKEVEIPQTASAVMSAPESLDEDVEMEEDSSDEDESDGDDEEDESVDDTAVSESEAVFEPGTVLPDLESRTQVHPANESSLDDSIMDTGDESEPALQSQVFQPDEGEADEGDEDEEEYEPTPDLDIVSAAKPVEESQVVADADEPNVLANEQSTVVEHHAGHAEDVHSVEQPSSAFAQSTTAPTLSDDLAPELQPAIADQVAVDDQDNVGEPKTYYRPYESALTHFKDYRYHPDFLQQVSDGYKSLTYSHRIDPVQPVCPAKAAGNACRDLKCPNQHFRSMGLTDNQLLKLLGTHRTPTTNIEDKQRWNKGLGDLVAYLRTTPASKDANAIATNIAQYRRDFVGDESRVLFLG